MIRSCARRRARGAFGDRSSAHGRPARAAVHGLAPSRRLLPAHRHRARQIEVRSARARRVAVPALEVVRQTGRRVREPDDLVLTFDGVQSGQLGLVFRSVTTGRVPFGDGVRCLTGFLRRFPPRQASAAGEITYGRGNPCDSEPQVYRFGA